MTTSAKKPEMGEEVAPLPDSKDLRLVIRKVQLQNIVLQKMTEMLDNQTVIRYEKENMSTHTHSNTEGSISNKQNVNKK